MQALRSSMYPKQEYKSQFSSSVCITRQTEDINTIQHASNEDKGNFQFREYEIHCTNSIAHGSTTRNFEEKSKHNKEKPHSNYKQKLANQDIWLERSTKVYIQNSRKRESLSNLAKQHIAQIILHRLQVQLKQQSNFSRHCTRQNQLTQRQRGRDPIEVAISRIQNQKLPTWQNLHRVRLNTKLASIKHRLHIEPTLKLHHRTARNRCTQKFHKSPTFQITTQQTLKNSEENNNKMWVASEIQTCFGSCFERPQPFHECRRSI